MTFSWSPFPRGGGGSGGVPDAPNDGYSYIRKAMAWLRSWFTSGYVSGRVYPCDYGLSVGTGGGVAVNTIYWTPMIIDVDTTISALTAEVTTPQTGALFRLSVFAEDPTNKGPLGAALGTTGDMTAATAAVVTGALGASLALPAGIYWVSNVCNTASVIFRCVAATQGWVSRYVGSTDTAAIFSANPGQLFYQLANPGAYGTLPTLTAGQAVLTRGTSRAFVSGFTVA